MHRTGRLLLSITVLIVASCQWTGVPGISTGSVGVSTAGVTQSAIPVPIATRPPGVIAAPTPGVTRHFGEVPEYEASAYTLGPWNADKAWDIIEAEPPEFPPNDKGQAYDESFDWAEVKLVLLHEIIQRFPSSVHVPDAVSLLMSPWGYPYSSEAPLEPFRAAFEDAINAEIVTDITPELLNTIISRDLHQQDIGIWEVLPANNVLGDGTPGWILDVRVSQSYGSAFALAGDPGSYRLVSPRKNWRAFAWSDQLVSAYDLNVNGVPEIAIVDSSWGMGMSHVCGEVLALYEWNGSGFVNLAPDVETHANTDSGDCLDFNFEQAPDGTRAITTGIRIYSGCVDGDANGVGDLLIQRRYEWNGDFFALAREEVLPLDTALVDGIPTSKCQLSWVNEAGAANDQAFRLLPTLLAETNPDRIEAFADLYGPAYLDFFRFKLGTWYAMRGQRSQATALLTQVRDSPAKPEFDAAPRLAEAFLQGYPASGAYAGCVAAGKVLDIHQFPSGDPLYLDTDAMRGSWGFSDWQWAMGGCSTLFSGPTLREDPLNVCSLTTAFALAVQKQTFANTDELVRWLDKQHIPYTGLQEGDVDGDARRDWLLLVGTGQGQSLHFWVLLDRGGAVLPLWVNDTHRTDGNIPATWSTFTPDPLMAPLNVYQWTDGMIIFRVVSSDRWIGLDRIHQSIGYYDGESFSGFTVEPAAGNGILDEDQAENLFVRIVDQPDWYTMGWDPSLNTLRVISSRQINQDQQVQAAESMLLDEGDAAAAVEVLNQLLGGEVYLIDQGSQEYDDPPRVRPYLQYLLGLAYEMSGDAGKAVVAYWELWHDFPAHPLSYVVRQKLVESKP